MSALRLIPFALGLALNATTIPVAMAGWVTNGTPATVAPQSQLNVQSIPDGTGGIIVAWEDYRNGNADIYAQRLDAGGNPLWGTDGMVICAEPLGQEAPLLASDGKGGAIIGWQDLRNGNYDLFAQRVTPAGSLRWAASGVPVSLESGNQTLQVIASDGFGDAFFAWRDFRSGESNVFAQRIDEDGVVQWSPNGIPVCAATGLQTDLRGTADPLGSFLLVWRDGRNGASSDIYAQAISRSGAALWAQDGVPVCTAPGDQFDASIVSDGRYGVVVAWQDFRNPLDSDVWAQRLGPEGTQRWTTDGIRLTAASGGQSNPLLVTDGLGGAIVAWTDARVTRPDIYAQRVDSTGTLAWLPANGVALCAADSSQFLQVGVSDGAGGAIFGWDDDRSGGEDIYAQSIAGNGTVRWAATGFLVATGVSARTLTTASSDMHRGAILAWQDSRNGMPDIYAFRISLLGTAVEPGDRSPLAANGRLHPARPNPFNPSTALEFELDRPGSASLAIYDARGRLVRTLASGTLPAGRHTVRWDGADDGGHPCASGVYYARLGFLGASRAMPITLLR